MTGADTLLQAAFAVLLPGDADFPPAAGLPLAGRLERYPHFGPAAEAMLARLPADLAELPESEQEAALRAIKDTAPAVMRDFVTAAYSLYYSDEAVLGAIARTANYTPRAPQPDGYALPAFDPQAVAVPAAHPPLFRNPEETPHG